MITFRLFGSARAAAGAGELTVPAGPTREVVDTLASRLPPRFADILVISSLVADGRRLDATSEAALPDGTVVDVLPPFAGG